MFVILTCDHSGGILATLRVEASAMNEAINKSVGAAIRNIRENKLRITQDELAGRLGISRPSITNIENGRQQLTVAQLLLFSKVMGVSPAALLPSEARTAQALTSEILPDDTNPRIRAWFDKLVKTDA